MLTFSGFREGKQWLEVAFSARVLDLKETVFIEQHCCWFRHSTECLSGFLNPVTARRNAYRTTGKDNRDVQCVSVDSDLVVVPYWIEDYIQLTFQQLDNKSIGTRYQRFKVRFTGCTS